MIEIEQKLYDDNIAKKTIQDLINIWLIDIKKDYDVVNLITGPEGSGKSTFAVLIATEIQKQFGYNFAFPTNFFEFLEAIKNDNIKIIIVDEAITNLNYRRAMSNENVAFTELLTMCRSKNKIILFLIPRFRLIDIYMRGDRVYHWLEIRHRDDTNKSGYALWFMRDLNNFATTDTFDIDSIERAIKEANPTAFKNEISEKILREKLFLYCKNYVGHVIYQVNDEVIQITKERSEKLKRDKMNEALLNLKNLEAEELLEDYTKRLRLINTILKTKKYSTLLTQTDKTVVKKLADIQKHNLLYKSKYQIQLNDEDNNSVSLINFI